MLNAFLTFLEVLIVLFCIGMSLLAVGSMAMDLRKVLIDRYEATEDRSEASVVVPVCNTVYQATRSFITGSRIYGNITDKSDLDLVILADDSAVEILKLHGGGMPIRFGVLNIIALSDPREFDAWRAAKDKCFAKAKELRRGLTHEEAVEIHEQELNRKKIERSGGHSGSGSPSELRPAA
jgi:hypothetical protein